MLDIAALRLTEREVAGLGWPWSLIDTQRRKDLWGIYDWLKAYENDDGTRPLPSYILNDALEQANIERPAAGK